MNFGEFVITEQTSDSVSVIAEHRTAFGKRNRALRRSGKTPVNVYGAQSKSLALQVEARTLVNAVRAAGHTRKVVLEVGDERIETIIRDVLLHPVSEALLHVDFMRVDSASKVSAAVPIRIKNAHLAPVTRGSIFNVTQILYRLTLRSKLSELPPLIEVDCGALEKPSETIRVADIKLPPGVEYLGDSDLHVVSVQMSRAAKAASSPTDDETAEDTPATPDDSDAESS